MKNAQKKDLAETLFITGDFTQKQIALKVEVTEKTIGKWKEDGKWEQKRKSLLTSKKDQLAFLYDQLDGIKQAISDREEGKRYANSKDTDSILKITQAIKNLETETGLTETIEVFTKLLKWLSKNNLEQAQSMEGVMDSYIQEMIN